MNNYLEKLNDKQREAVCCTEGPLLILAGAGSGKTRVLTHRIAYLMSEKNVDPYNIMAITFTNKAAAEMRERVNKIAGFGAEAVWVSTFHSACARILRRFADRLGYTTDFSIYDTDDTKQVIKTVLTDMNADSKRFPPKKVLSVISSCKNHNMTYSDFLDEARTRDDEIIGEAFKLYNERLYRSNAMDFDDLLLKTVELFKRCPDVLEGYQKRLKYISVDEYQDTNQVQFEFVRLLAGKSRNLCVVGDDDQSIYKFRGADIRNILEFEKYFPDAHVVKLEQNYRSTGNILDCANEVIKNNVGRKSKRLWTDAEEGEKVSLNRYSTAFEEAAGVVREIRSGIREGKNAGDYAILYRTNAQSRLFEEQFIYNNIPYQIIGGTNFYSRKEIKDILAYLKTIANGSDDIAVKRIINIPRRGIGARSISRIDEYASQNYMTFFKAACEAEAAGLGSAAAKIDNFTLFIRKFRTQMTDLTIEELINRILKETGYLEELLQENTDESLDRVNNINELISKAAVYDESAELPTLTGFLEEVALVADIDSMETEGGKVVLMTIHSAKGLEFDNVYLVGMEDGLFPGFRTIFDIDESEMEEERRLAYVGMTRAKKTLTLTAARERVTMGEHQIHKISRFVEEIPEDMLQENSASRTYSYYEKKQTADIPREPVKVKPTVSAAAKFDPKQFKVTKQSSLDYSVGDRVSHRKFGAGTVTAITDGTKDYEVTVDFDTAGTKRLYASFAKLVKQ